MNEIIMYSELPLLTKQYDILVGRNFQYSLGNLEISAGRLLITTEGKIADTFDGLPPIAISCLSESFKHGNKVTSGFILSAIIVPRGLASLYLLSDNLGLKLLPEGELVDSYRIIIQKQINSCINGKA